MHSVAKDPEALSPALLILGLASICAALGGMFFPSVMGLVIYRSDFSDVVVEVVLSIVLGIGSLYMIGYVAEQGFHSKLDMNGYVRVMGHGTLVYVLSILLVLTPVSLIWELVIMCTVLHKLGKLEAGPIVLLILIEILMVGSIVLLMPI